MAFFFEIRNRKRPVFHRRGYCPVQETGMRETGGTDREFLWIMNISIVDNCIICGKPDDFYMESD